MKLYPPFAILLAFVLQITTSGNAYSEDPAEPPAVGIARRTPWTTSRITGSPYPPPAYQIEQVFEKLKFDKPVEMIAAPAGDRLLVVELDGKIFSFVNSADVATSDLFIDLAAEIEGMTRAYGLAFHPDFAVNRYCYICYVTKPDAPDCTFVSRFQVTDTDPPRCDPSSETVLLRWKSGGHNGGSLQFGPDGCLYISTGDGSGPFPADIHDSGQDISDLLASILRIDVDHASADRPYSIPKDNPFVGLADARGEVWAYGMRNPWRMCFDRPTGDLWVGDVGWEMWEMIYRVERGGNYGWSITEGRQSVHPERRRGPTPILPPTVEHSHTESRSITGGYVYRGDRLPDLKGAYIYGDYVTGKIWSFHWDGQHASQPQELVDTPLAIICFGVDNAGELYVVDYAGTIHRLVPNPSAGATSDFPTKLSDTGLFASPADHQTAPGVIPYSINAEPWADHATAERFVALPGTSQLGVHTTNNPQVGDIRGQWQYPSDSVLVKTLSLELQRGDPSSRRRIETQILHRDVDTWRAYTFVWNDEQTDAELVGENGLDRVLTIVDSQAPGGKRQQTWRFASRSECVLCHTTRGGSIYGFNVSQLNKRHDYAGVTADQLRTLDHIGLFAEPLPNEMVSIPSPDDAGLDINARARAYLHVNCAHCHQRGGGGTAAMDLPFHLNLANTNTLGAVPTQGTLGIEGAQVIASGDPYRSVLFYRMAKLGRGHMPHFGSTLIDEQGLTLIHDWIKQIPPLENAPPIHEAAVRALADESAALSRLTSVGPDDDKQAAAIEQLLKSPSGALRLVRAIDDQLLAPKTQLAAIAAASVSLDPQVRDLFERFIPDEQRVKRLGTAIQPDEILALSGDATRGRRLFLSTAGVQCKTCHRIQTDGGQIGPDLSQIGKKYDRAQLLETILEPSKKIDPQWVSYAVETAAGRIHTGMLVERTPAAIILRDAQNQLIRIPAGDVEQLAPQEKSLMPELLLRDMTVQEVADLLEFLAALK